MTTYDWSAFYDDEGRLYYYNSTTDESSWEPPEQGFNPPEDPPPAAADAGAEDEPAAAATTEEEDPYDYSAEPPDASAEPPEDNNSDDDDDGANDGVSQEPPSTPPPATPPMDDDEDDDGVTQEPPADGGDDAAIEWVAYKDDDGLEYYYNTVTGETQWDKPTDKPVKPYEEVAAAAGAGDEDGEKQQQATGDAMDVDKEQENLPPEPEEEPVEEEEEIIDPAVKRAQDAELALNQHDSVLEPNCMVNVLELVTSEGGNPQKAISLLLDSYQGQTAIGGLLCRWLAEIRVPAVAAPTDPAAAAAAAALASSSDTPPSQAVADGIRDVVQDVIYKIVRERFSKEAGDSILNLSKAEAAFLEDMMDSPRWRRLLIDLSAKHKDSAVLMYCLRAISKRGHHREIAKRVNQSDHFAVFNAMLLSELTSIGTLGMSAGSDVQSAIGLKELVDDLRRANTSTSYTYLYSVEMLRFLVEKVKTSFENEGSGGPEDRLSRVLRKWQALSQDLESTMMDPAAASATSASPLFRKRRLEVALTISDLHQRQRKRRRNHYDDNNNGGGETGNSKKLETALLDFLRRYSTGIQISDSVLDSLLPQGLDVSTAKITGRLLIEHPLAIKALLTYLYKPGSTRINALVVKNKCAKLVAFSVLAAEKVCKSELPDYEEGESVESVSDEVAITRMILEGSQICEQLESMVSFLVSSEPTTTAAATPAAPSAASPGPKLCQLVFKCAAVAQGVILWARELTHGPEFAASASFPTLSVSILSLVRIVSLHYPFTRRDALEVGLNFLRHSNSDISYLKLNAIKEQSLRMMIFLLLKGEVISVLSAITSRLEKAGTSDMDASLVRYFVSGVLQIVQPGQPVSILFVRLFGALLKTQKALDAVRSSYFGEPHKTRLVQLLKSFPKLTAMDGVSPLTPEDEKFIHSLLTSYQIS